MFLETIVEYVEKYKLNSEIRRYRIITRFQRKTILALSKVFYYLSINESLKFNYGGNKMLKFLKSIRAKHTLDKIMKNSEKVEVPEEIEELAESIGGGYWNYRWFQLTYKDKYGTET